TGAKPSDLSRSSALLWESFCALRRDPGRMRENQDAIPLAAGDVRQIVGGDRWAATDIERARQPLDAVGGGMERGRDRGLGRLGAVGCNNARILQGRQLVLGAAELLALLAQLVRDREGRHDGEPAVADLAEGIASRLDAQVEILRQPPQMFLLPVLARHPVLASVDADGYLPHDTRLCSRLITSL